MRHLLAALFTCTLFAAPVMAESNIYKWVDANGVTHFGAQPPQNVKAEEVKPRVAPANAAPSTAPQAAEAAKDEKPKDADKTKDSNKQMVTISAEQIAEQCKNAQARLQQLESSPRLMTRGADGQMARVPEEERQKMISEERARVQDYCGQ